MADVVHLADRRADPCRGCGRHRPEDAPGSVRSGDVCSPATSPACWSTRVPAGYLIPGDRVALPGRVLSTATDGRTATITLTVRLDRAHLVELLDRQEPTT